MSSKIGLRVFSADLKSEAVTLILYFGAPTYKIFTLFWFSFSKPCKLFLMFSTPFELLSVNSKMPQITTEGNLFLTLTSSITSKIYFANFKSLKTLIPFLAISTVPS